MAEAYSAAVGDDTREYRYVILGKELPADAMAWLREHPTEFRKEPVGLSMSPGWVFYKAYSPTTLVFTRSLTPAGQARVEAQAAALARGDLGAVFPIINRGDRG